MYRHTDGQPIGPVLLCSCCSLDSQTGSMEMEIPCLLPAPSLHIWKAVGLEALAQDMVQTLMMLSCLMKKWKCLMRGPMLNDLEQPVSLIG